MKKILIIILFLLLAFYVSNAADESIVINYNKKISNIVGLTLGVRPYQNINKLSIHVISHSFSNSWIEKSVHKIVEETSYANYFYYFRDNDGIVQVVDEKTKIVVEIGLIFNLFKEVKIYGSLEEAYLALIETINQESGIYLKKDIDYEIIDEIINVRRSLLIEGINNSILYSFQKNEKYNYLVVKLIKNT